MCTRPTAFHCSPRTTGKSGGSRRCPTTTPRALQRGGSRQVAAEAGWCSPTTGLVSDAVFAGSPLGLVPQRADLLRRATSRTAPWGSFKDSLVRKGLPGAGREGEPEIFPHADAVLPSSPARSGFTRSEDAVTPATNDPRELAGGGGRHRRVGGRGRGAVGDSPGAAEELPAPGNGGSSPAAG